MEYLDFTVSEVPFAYYKKCASDLALQMRNRPSDGVTLVLEGALDIEYADHTEHAEAGDIIAQRKGDSYCLRGVGEQAPAYIVISYLTEPSDVLSRLLSGRRVLHPAHARRYRDTFERAARIYQSGSICSVPLLRALVQEILCDLIREDYPDALVSEDNPVAAAYYYMEEFFYRPLTVGDIAEAAGCSASYLRLLFSRTVGEPPMQCLNRIRIERAKQMLSSGMFSMSEVATSCGFQNVYYFSRVFKRMSGTTPGKY